LYEANKVVDEPCGIVGISGVRDIVLDNIIGAGSIELVVVSYGCPGGLFNDRQKGKKEVRLCCQLVSLNLISSSGLDCAKQHESAGRSEKHSDENIEKRRKN
jgi:hypothetical protein